MNSLNFEENSIGKLLNTKRRAINNSLEQVVKLEFLSDKNLLPLVISPRIDGVNLLKWAEKNKDLVTDKLLNYGGILFRDFNLSQVEDFQELIKTLSQGNLLEYTYRSTPRTQVSGKIYSSTEYPPDQSIPLHNENAYSSNWPMKIFFFSVKVAEQRGETPIADSRKIFQRINPAIRERFIDKKVMYVRNYDALDLPWQEVFQTTNKSEVEAYCQKVNIEFEWRGDNNLRTRQICQAVAKHPNTGEMVWFNQAHLFHISSLKPELRESLLSVFQEDELPRNAYYGDGTCIETSVLDEIRDIYSQEAIVFSWHKGDILMLDNMLAAHGRMPFVGERKVLVGMSDGC